MEERYLESIEPIISDLKYLLEYIGENNIKLTKSKCQLGKKDCFLLNSKFKNNIKVDKAVYMQEKYVVVDFLFKILIRSKVFRIKSNSKGGSYLSKTYRFDELMNLNDYEKYLFIVECFWKTSDFYKDFGWEIRAFIDFILQLGEEKDEEIILNKNSSIATYNSKYADILEALGLCKLERDYLAKGKYDIKITKIYRTELGKSLCKKLIREGLQYINLDGINFLFDEYHYKKTSKSMKSIVSEIISRNQIKNVINIDEKMKAISGNSTLKIMLENDLYRILKVSNKDTFEFLHLYIQNIFDFDNDHCYAFYDRDGNEFYSGNPMAVSIEYDPKLAIGDLALEEGESFNYLFDFGDCWRFMITVEEVMEDEECISEAELIDAIGESPEQYPEWD